MDKTIGIKTITSNIAELFKIIEEQQQEYDQKLKIMDEKLKEIEALKKRMEKDLSTLDQKINDILNN